MTPKSEHTARQVSGKRQARTRPLYAQICKMLESGRRYRDTSFTAGRIAQELSIHPRDISEAVATHFGDNFNALVNSYRLRDAQRMIRQPRYSKYTLEEIGLLAGFNSRQSFYTAFGRAFHCTPKQYRAATSDTQTSASKS